MRYVEKEKLLSHIKSHDKIIHHLSQSLLSCGEHMEIYEETGRTNSVLAYLTIQM